MKFFLYLFFIPFFIFSQDARDIAKKCIPNTVSLVMEDSYRQPLSLGSGFIVDKGKIITNLHVLENAGYGHVTISGDSKKHIIEGYYCIDRTNDLVLLSVPTIYGNAIEFSTINPEIGEKIYAIGNPKGLSGTISEGIISGVRKVNSNELLQITAPISPGSSGGPVLNNNGELIGVSVGAIESGQNLNFAIPTKYVISLLNSNTNQLKKLDLKLVQKSTTSNVKKSINEGLVIINIEWEPNTGGGEFTKPIGYDLAGFTIKNNLPNEIKDITLLLILRNSQGIPIDSQEVRPYIGYNYIKPFLSKYVKVGFGNGTLDNVNERIRERKLTEKLEIRILDFSIKE